MCACACVCVYVLTTKLLDFKTILMMTNFTDVYKTINGTLTVDLSQTISNRW